MIKAAFKAPQTRLALLASALLMVAVMPAFAQVGAPGMPGSPPPSGFSPPPPLPAPGTEPSVLPGATPGVLPGNPNVPPVVAAPATPTQADQAAAMATAVHKEQQLTYQDVSDKLDVTRDELWVHRDQLMYTEMLSKFQATIGK